MFGNVLVTGGAGFIGSQLIRKILPLSQHIYVIDDLSTGRREAIPISPKITFIEDSITNKKVLKNIIPKVEYVFHLACSNILKSVDDLDLDFHTNLLGGFLLLQSAKIYGSNLKRFVYASTTSIYGDAANIPTTEDYYKISLPYAASKFSTEHYCSVYYHMYQLPVTVLRLSNVYGPGQTSSNPYCGVVAKFFEAVEKNEPLVIYGDGHQTRDFTFIEDALDAFLLVTINEEAIGQVYNVGTGMETPIIKLAKEIKTVTGSTQNLKAFKGKRPVDIVARRNIDSLKIQMELQWRINHSLSEGLEKTFKWLEEEKIR
ncbi:NAD-dependent epimerase/dehydratase [Alkaliphilus metalliredigens QYMF]|uniref:NAD-dependent epimerase/dehydratase n=1 Tax=Alkaliphilus metalliredigens (strain QYMF) TaxID=293826 RepID=A6TTQ2_ALKMQ|nr:NAD-dependent epimerase/dehydratase family protein [Alkaliphilus metalliredigens]ABR49570.1 NAD-dependent epimerase/dehydratase [Alkaliphilus metalliredigens QYMF]